MKFESPRIETERWTTQSLQKILFVSFRLSSNFSKGMRDPQTRVKLQQSLRYQLANMCSFNVLCRECQQESLKKLRWKYKEKDSSDNFYLFFHKMADNNNKFFIIILTTRKSS